MTIEKYINEDGLVGIVYGYEDYQSEKELFNKELVKIVVEKDYESYLKMFESKELFNKKPLFDPHLNRRWFDGYQVKFLKPGTRFKVLLGRLLGEYGQEWYVLTEEDMFTA